ncbi:MAG: sugar phosphate isomerase/epimerase [Clostridia bacterium]|nr:sugar phosphate isomerase/epimerase [Clostridia bacterium]
MEVGAQLYTLRASCKTLEDFALTLRRVADMGYRTVQVSGTCPYPAEWLRDQLAANGLRCVLTHTPLKRIAEETEQVIRDHDVFGCHYIGLGFWSYQPDSEMTLERFLSVVPPAARKLREGGKYFMAHNHDHEFQHVDGKPILQILAETVPAEDMGFTLDTFWVQAGGADPADWIRRLSGRVPCVHLKDFAYGRRMAVLGEGNLNFDRILAEAEAAGTQYLLVEQDDCNGEDPFDCLARSLAYLKARGLR